MPKKSVSKSSANDGPKSALIYARVSSKEQEKEGFSIPAQLKLLHGYAVEHGLEAVQEFVDVETAKQTGRTHFEKMVRYVKAHPSVRILLVEKTDRLYRNLRDWVTLDELDIEIHLVKEGIVLSRESRSSEKFVHGIKVLMAKNYVDNLSEEARKGMQEKADQGIWPSCAPLGYINVTGPDGKKCIAPDPRVAGQVTRLFEWYATGTLSVKEATAKAHAEGLIYPRTGARISTSDIHRILRKRIYTGDFDWKGERYAGRHQPLVTRELWDRVQDVLDGRFVSKVQTRTKRNFAFTGLITCGHCGCSVVGEMKKGRYVYYHCTGFKGKCPGPYVREEALEAKFSELLGKLSFSDDVLAWLTRALKESHADEKQEHDAAIARLQTEYDRLKRRVQTAYLDKLDGRIEAAFFDQMSESWRAEQDRCLSEMKWHQTADQSYMNEGVGLLELASKARQLFASRGSDDKRRLLNFVLSNCVWKDGELTAEFKQPFDLLAETSGWDPPDGDGGGGENGEKSKWRRERDCASRDKSAIKSRHYQLGILALCTTGVVCRLELAEVRVPAGSRKQS